MRKNYCYILAFLLTFVSSYSFGQGAIIGALKNVKVFRFGNGRQVSTYEDVEEVNVEPKFDSVSLPIFNYTDLPSSPIRERDKRNYTGNILPGSIIPDTPCDGPTFLQNHFQLDYGSEQGGVWVPKIYGVDGRPNMGSRNPGKSPKFWFTLKRGGFKVVNNNFSSSKLDSITADASSCVVAKHLCDLGAACSHLFTSRRNVISNLQNSVRAKASEIEDPTFNGDDFVGRNTGLYAQVAYKDRTPPWVDFCDDDKFPPMGDSIPIYTGDWFCFKGLKIRENYEGDVKAKIALGKIDDCPTANTDWTDSEVWVSGDVYTIPMANNEGWMDNVFSSPPNYCYGYMRYTVFAQDKGILSSSLNRIVANLNPGCASILEDEPTICYGLPNTNKYYDDLLTSPLSAKPWPYRENNQNIPAAESSKMTVEKITGDDRVHEGYIRISDNDLPNILIKIVSSKYGEEKKMFFPPCIPDGKLTINNSPDYRGKYDSYSGSGFYNQKDYDSFVGESRNILKECNYDEVIKSNKRPYFTIIELKGSNLMNPKDAGKRNSLLQNTDPAFINKHFRLEDQSHSDTNEDGTLDSRIEYNGESLFGKRNGTWEEVVALVENLDDSEIQIQEDVEYQISVWVDDSVKWANCYRNETNMDTSVKAIPTGIDECTVEVNIPNQVPVFHRDYSFAKSAIYSGVDKSIKDDIRVVFREPTDANIETKDITSESVLIDKKFPSITVEAKDYAGLTRKVKLYFRVKDENAKIKTLQRRHQQYN